MVSPQIENGYTKIANELLDAIVRCKLPGDEGQVFWTIIRKTYGFNKKMDRIALSQFNLATGLLKPHICRALSKLIEKNMITKSGKGNLPSYRLQKDYTKWKSLPKSVILPDVVTPITESGNSALPNLVNYKRHILTKDNDTKREAKASPSVENNPIDIKLTQLLITLIQKNDIRSDIIRKLTPKRQETWIDECRKLREIGKRTPEEIEFIIKWCQEDSFWKSNILSMPKLREKFGQLWLKARKDDKYKGAKIWLAYRERLRNE